MLTANAIRQQFIDFFVQKHGHTFVPSSSVVPLDDPTLLFTNAGMNQFKDVFLGTGTRPYKRAANTQKCIRAGGKHNDLDDVGKDTYHHTFFEMLGNWSFGDYFKKEAIAWAWELLTKVWGLDKTRLHATVFEGDSDLGLAPDDEAAELWRTVTDIDPTHIHKGNKKDNFWEMGDTGPCGPCTEVHIDRTPNKSGGALVNKGTADVIEIWNLVFIQFNRNPDRSLTPLPAKHVDTGMGFERVTAVIQDKASNYDTDVFSPIFDEIQKQTKATPYSGSLHDMRDVAYRVIADHMRTLTYAIADGAVPGAEGRGYVLRRILRRAERYGRQYLGQGDTAFLWQFVPTVAETMRVVFPLSIEEQQRIAKIIVEEEAAFIKTLGRGIWFFEQAADQAKQSGNSRIGGQDAFRLHDTYGLYIDITEQMAAEAGLTVDRIGFDLEMERAKGIARGAQKKHLVIAVTGELPNTDDSPKYQGLTCSARVVASIKDNRVGSGQFTSGDEAALVLDRTNFYAEQGGQVGDAGTITTATGVFDVADTQRLGDSVLHYGKVRQGTILVGQNATLEIAGARAETMRNHTATHLLNWALRKVLGDHVEQKGSLVDPEKTRFDFAHTESLTAEQIAEIERLVNEKIYADLPVTAVYRPLEQAKKIAGVRAVFGEKYPDPVRVLLVGALKPEEATLDTSVEFCGGTHLNHTGQAGFFKIVGQELVGAGVRRVTAVTGREAVATVQKLTAVVNDLTARFKCSPAEVPARVDSLQAEIKKLQQQLKKSAASDLQGAADKLLASAADVKGAKVIVGEMPAGPEEQMRAQIDRIKQKAGSAVVVVGWADDGKVSLIAAVTDDLVKKGVHGGKLIGQIAKVVGGGGGGKPAMAQAGGKDPAKLGEALALAQQLATQQLGG
jgi:alanyl-tRNA synthetase